MTTHELPECNGHTKVFGTLKPETIRRNAARRQREREASESDLAKCLLEKYQGEPDHEYAEAMWGSMLRERGLLFTKRER